MEWIAEVARFWAVLVLALAGLGCAVDGAEKIHPGGGSFVLSAAAYALAGWLLGSFAVGAL
jgi:hypothetical protein